MDAVNATGEIFLSHTKLNGRYTLRLAIGNMHTQERHVARAWELLQTHVTTGPLYAEGVGVDNLPAIFVREHRQGAPRPTGRDFQRLISDEFRMMNDFAGEGTGP